MIYLILDTNYWIYLAKGEHPKVFDRLKKDILGKKFQILINHIIIDEWNRNKNDIISEIQKSIRNQAIAAEEISDYLEGTEQDTFQNIIRNYKVKEESRIDAATQRVKAIEDIFYKHAIVTPIDDRMRLRTIELALAQKAPFTKNKNSVGDALILLSSVEYLREHGLVSQGSLKNLSEAIFVTFNHTEFAASGQEKDKIHPDLEFLFNSVGMKYIRNIGQILDLAPQMIAKIDEYIEYAVDSWIDWQIEIMRGK